MKWVNSEKTLVVYYELTDELYDKVKKDNRWNYNLINEMVYCEGDNVFITLLINNGKKEDIMGLLRSNCKYKNIGFWNRGNKRFIDIRRSKND